MKYRRFTTHSQDVSEIGLGAWQLGVQSGWKGMSEKEAIQMVHAALEHGINFIDTAPNYGYGTSEERLGKALSGIDRNRFVINTKFGHKDTGGTDYSAGYIRASLEGSLRRLKLDYVDSLIIHNPPFEILDGRTNAHYEILEALKQEGKIKAYGASLDRYDEMKLLMDTTGAEVIEAFFNILHQDAARAFDMAKAKNVGIIVKVPLDSGWLTGKYNSESQFDDIRSRWSQEDIKTRALLVEKIRDIIGPGYALSEAALSFCLSYDAVSTVIPGNVSLGQLEKNIDVNGKRLSNDMVRSLEAFYIKEVKPCNLPW